jgi:protein tyrosine phosphatase (PTP) superfamily phosphohydrolase (DUF442 family)
MPLQNGPIGRLIHDACGLVVLATACSAPAIAQDELRAPNVVAISATLVTSGQPAADELRKLAARGFAAVVYLAPPTVADAVREEPEIVRGQGLEFVNIPIDFGAPTEADFRAFAATMDRLKGRKVLVHCQVNMRASAMTFLYRAVVSREDPDRAYEAVARVWSPQGPWKALIVAELGRAGIAFEPY